MSPLFAEASPLENAIWQCVAQVVALGIVGFFVNILYQRYRQRATARQAFLILAGRQQQAIESSSWRLAV